ncbi:MAG: hypothetical protein ABR955_03805 [Verrucomicrobiota bacterium]
MTNDKSDLNFSNLDALRRYVPLAVWTVVILTILIIPLKIISYGYLPQDDALADAAKAVSGKSWQQILVLGPSYIMDHHLGWHWLLEKIYLWSHCSIETLVLVAVTGLFVLFGLSALPWLNRPEAWLVSLILAYMTPDIPGRLLSGRPFVLSISVLVALTAAWQKNGFTAPKWSVILWVTGLFTASIFFHAVWYLWVLPITAFFLAGQFRWGAVMTLGWLAGTVLGAMLTGHPFNYIAQTVELARRVIALHPTQTTLVSELSASGGDFSGLILVGGWVIMRQLAKLEAIPLSRNPVFWLMAMGWILGCETRRFWDDWGCPALMVLLAFDLQSLMQTKFVFDSFKRLTLSLGLAVTTYAVITSDADSRWSHNLAWDCLTPDNSAAVGWLPDKGGIFYSADMNFFYQTFFNNPHADWRYLVGFEPALMPDEDFEVYERITWNLVWYGGTDEGYKPWVNKMRPQDRLAIRSETRPNIPELEWKEVTAHGLWIGRLPRTKAPSSAPAIPATKPLKTQRSDSPSNFLLAQNLYQSIRRNRAS